MPTRRPRLHCRSRSPQQHELGLHAKKHCWKDIALSYSYYHVVHAVIRSDVPNENSIENGAVGEKDKTNMMYFCPQFKVVELLPPLMRASPSRLGSTTYGVRILLIANWQIASGSTIHNHSMPLVALPADSGVYPSNVLLFSITHTFLHLLDLPGFQVST